MIKTITFLLFIAVANIISGQKVSISQQDLIGCWKHLPEESSFNPDILTFRPCNYNSFPSRRVTRTTYTMDLRAYGIYYYPIIGANDINSAKQGRWSFNSSTNELELLDMEMNSIVKFKIEKLERRLLRLIRVTN